MNVKNVLGSKLEFYDNWNNSPSENLWWALMCKWVRHFLCLIQENAQLMRSGFTKKSELGIEIIHGWHFLFIHSVIFKFSPNNLNFIRWTANRLCVFFWVHACLYVSSNPALGSFCPLQAQCQQPDFDVKPQFIRLSPWTPLLST